MLQSVSCRLHWNVLSTSCYRPRGIQCFKTCLSHALLLCSVKQVYCLNSQRDDRYFSQVECFVPALFPLFNIRKQTSIYCHSCVLRKDPVSPILNLRPEPVKLTYYPHYLSSLARALLHCLRTTFLELAVYAKGQSHTEGSTKLSNS